MFVLSYAFKTILQGKAAIFSPYSAELFKKILFRNNGVSPINFIAPPSDIATLDTNLLSCIVDVVLYFSGAN